MKIIFYLAMLMSMECFAESIENAILKSGLTETPVPTGGILEKANRSNDEYCIEELIGKISIRKEKRYCSPPESSLTMNGYQFFGTNNGEFGGELSVKSPNGQKRILIDDNVVKLISYNNELYAFTGLAHMLTSRGAVYKINFGERDVTTERITLLPDAPKAIVTLPGNKPSFLIISSSGLIKLNLEDDAMDVILLNQFWNVLYPQSAIFRDGRLAIGMRSGIVMITLGQLNKVVNLKYFTKPASTSPPI